MRLLTALTTLGAFGGLASAASLAQVSNFGENPTSIQMYIYVPDNVSANPAVIVAVSSSIPTEYFRVISRAGLQILTSLSQ